MANKPVNLYLCLVHYPVYNRYGEIVATSVTPLDLHDLGRTGLTYGASGYFVITPFDSQWELLNEIIDHWREGIGAEKQPQRQQALGTAKLARTMGDAYDEVARIEGVEPYVAATTARWAAGTIPAQTLLNQSEGRPLLLLFGTGYGLTEDVLLAADAILDPIPGRVGFNHLPVRSAVAIYLDRIYTDY
jgi:hypothetical protein